MQGLGVQSFGSGMHSMSYERKMQGLDFRVLHIVKFRVKNLGFRERVRFMGAREKNGAVYICSKY